MTYCGIIRDAIKNNIKENEGRIITTQEIDEMPVERAMHLFLEWEGIIGYDYYMFQFLDEYLKRYKLQHDMEVLKQ